MKTGEFPYLTEIKVNDCYTYQDFTIPIGNGDGKSFRHLILTGKNGSGKTTILKGVGYWMNWMAKGQDPTKVVEKQKNELGATYLYPTSTDFNKIGIVPSLKDHQEKLNQVVPKFKNDLLGLDPNTYVYSFFQAQRRTNLSAVNSATKNSEILERINESDFSNKLKQYLVNKKVFEAFDLIDSNFKEAKESTDFFIQLNAFLTIIFDDNNLKLNFVKEEFEFYIKLNDGREITFNQLADGFSAFLSILLELLVRVDIVRKNLKDYKIDPCGIVIIDEPEAHFHLEMQYNVLPMLTKLFPNIQFVIATHSPAVISSIAGAVVFDLTKQKVAPQSIVGSSYSDLMVTHFGLDNEYSNIADKIIEDVQKLVESNKRKSEKVVLLKKILMENEQYITPSMLLAIETDILKIEETA